MKLQGCLGRNSLFDFPQKLRKSMFRDFTSFQQGFKEWHLSGLTIEALKRKQNVINPERGFVE